MAETEGRVPIACGESLPQVSRREQAERAVAEWNLVAQLRAHPAFAFLLESLSRRRLADRYSVFDEGKEDQWLARQIKADAHLAVAQVLDEMRSAADTCGQLLGVANWGKRQVRRPYKDPVEAQAALREAQALLEMIELPGWKVLTRRIAALTWAYLAVRDAHRPEEAKELTERANALCGLFRDVQQRIDRGTDAAIALERLEKQEKESSHAR